MVRLFFFTEGDTEPTASQEVRESNCTPMAFMIYNITEEEATLLLKWHIWLSQSISFCITMLVLVCLDFLFTIKGMATLTNTNIKATVKRAWKSDGVSLQMAGVI